MTEIKETIKYQPYLGELEPITEVHASEIKIYDKYIEIISSYAYTAYMPEDDTCGYKRNATVIPKHLMTIELTEAWHRRDVKKTPHPVIKISYLDCEDYIDVETEKEAYDIYNRIKRWMLND